MPLPPNFFSVDSYDLKSMSFKFGNAIFIAFKNAKVILPNVRWQIYILLLFRPSASEVLALLHTYYEMQFRKINLDFFAIFDLTKYPSTLSYDLLSLSLETFSELTANLKSDEVFFHGVIKFYSNYLGYVHNFLPVVANL